MQRLITIPVKQYEKMLQTYDDVVKELMALREQLEESERPSGRSFYTHFSMKGGFYGYDTIIPAVI